MEWGDSGVSQTGWSGRLGCELEVGVGGGLLTWEEFPAGHGSSPVALVFHEGEASVFGFVCSTRVDNDVHNALGYLLHFC